MSNNVNDFLEFNPYETEAAESFEGRQEAIPNGTYKAIASSATRKHNKNKTGWFWELVFTVIEGQYEGRTVTHRFNMANPNDEAVAIGRSHMKRYLDCIGKLNPPDENALCNIAVVITVTCKKNEYTNRNGKRVEGINNEITKIDPAFNAPKEPAAASAKSADPPWKR